MTSNILPLQESCVAITRRMAFGLGRMLLRSIVDVPPECTTVRLAPALTFYQGQ